MRRRWRLTSTKAAQSTLLPMEDSPGSSGAASSLQMVAPPPAPHFDVESVSDGDDTRSPSFCFDSTINKPALSARSLFRPLPNPRLGNDPLCASDSTPPFRWISPSPNLWLGQLDRAGSSSPRLSGFHSLPCSERELHGVRMRPLCPASATPMCMPSTPASRLHAL